MEVDFRCVF